MKSLRFLALFLFIIPFSSMAQIKYFSLPEHVSDTDYIAKTIIVNVKEEYRGQCSESGLNIDQLSRYLSMIGVNEIKKKFPGKKPPASKLNKYGEKMEDLSLFYEIKYNSEYPIEKAINTLLSSGVFEYAEPHYLPYLFYVPSDPYAEVDSATFVQYHLVNIKAYEAWDIQQSDTNIVIGITDTGTDIYHPDLYDNIKKNYLDPVNGIDDDGDGFKDNYFGWDIAENDSCPQWEGSGHGVFVSGNSSAVTDNGEGMAGVGFKAKYLPIKICDSQGALTMAYEGIVYAADHGCSIINCSWGGIGGAGQYGQTVVNYATNNCDALVIAACGNADNDYSYYPASYNNVISVAASNWDDCKWHDTTNHKGSSYGMFVDLCAPGENISSTWVNGSYLFTQDGTSFASPITAGAAALIKSHYPSYSAIQIGEQLRLTTDNIDTLDCNEGQPWEGQMGTGRLNIYKALTTTNIPSLVMISKTATDNNDESYVADDTLRIVGKYKNYLGPSSAGLKVTLSTESSYADVLPAYNSTILGSMATFDTVSNYLDPFLVKILPGIPVSTQVDFKLTFEDAGVGYMSSQYFSIIVNVDYIDIDTNRIGTTVTSKGKLGYNLDGYYEQGIGFTYDNSMSYLDLGGFLLGVNNTQVSDNLYADIAGYYDDDFKTSEVVHRVVPPLKSDFETECIFNDSLAPTGTAMNVTVTHKSFTWVDPPNDKFIIMEYTIKNHGTSTLNALYAGLFMDFNMSDDLEQDMVNYDATNKMSYTYSLLGGPYAAIQLLTSDPVHHYAFDKDGASNGTSMSLNIDNGFTGNDKYSALKINQSRNTTSPLGNDVADMLSTGPFVLTPGDSVTVAFALIAGDHLADIQSSAVAADGFYNHYGIDELPGSDLASLKVYPNPAKDKISISFDLLNSAEVYVTLIDICGKTLLNEKSGKLASGHHEMMLNTEAVASGIYAIRIIAGSQVLSKEVTISK